MTALDVGYFRVQTNVLQCKDFRVYRGPKEELDILLRVIALWRMTRNRLDDDELAADVVRRTKGNALLITIAADLFAGTATLEKIRKLLEEEDAKAPASATA